MLIRKSTHDAIVAAKDAEIADINDRRLKAKEFLSRNHKEIERQMKTIWAMEDENAALRAKLARYTAPRQRDAKGHFLPLDQVQA